MQEQMMEVRKELKENPRYDKTFPFTLLNHRKVRKKVEVKDYIPIDDFYSTLGKRMNVCG